MRKILCICVALCLTCSSWAKAATMSWSTIGNPGNASDFTGAGASGGAGPNGFVGDVNYTYKIGTYEVTNSQYVAFLNAKDPTGDNQLGLYYSGMGSDALNGGIAFNSAAASGSRYSVIDGRGNYPVTYVTWYSAARFANWMNNGQGNGSTETGAYNFGPLDSSGIPLAGNALARAAGAKIALPTESEWYKAAYYDPSTSSYNKFPTSSSSLPSPQPPPGDPNSANYVPGGWPNPDYAGSVGHLTAIGAYSTAPSPYGTFDQGGNALEWNEQVFSTGRGLRGGSFTLVWDHMLGSYRDSASPKFGWYNDVGFRLVNLVAVPEPSTSVLSALGAIGLALFGIRRRRRTG